MKKKQWLACFVLATGVWSASQSRAGNQSFTYDPAGRLIGADFGAGKSVSYAYDNSGNLLQSSMPAPGLLARRSGNQITLAWPFFPAGFVLEMSVVLGPGASWSAVGATPAQTGNQLIVTNNIGPGTLFYRLRKPLP